MRRPTLKYVLIFGLTAIVLAGIVFGTIVVWNALCGEWVTASVQSASPDGMFRCTLTERWSGGLAGGYEAKVVVEKMNGQWRWEEVKQAPVDVDVSLPRSNYSIIWEYDSKHRTTGLILFGDYGSPPFRGTVLFRMSMKAEP